MSSVLDRDALEGSPLSDLHLIADQLGVDGYRRLRKADLIDAIVAKQGGEDASDAPRPKRRARARKADAETSAAVEAADKADDEEEADEPRQPLRRRAAKGAPKAAPQAAEDTEIDGVVELQPNGSGFVKADGQADVYVSAAQVKRCELVTGDKVTGPVRPPRRSERYPSLVRVDTINGKPADEVAGEGKGVRFEDLKACFPMERLELGGSDPTVQAVQWLTPFGKGSRVVVAGGPLAGKSELLRRITNGLSDSKLEVRIAFAGARPEEAGEWGEDLNGAWLGSSADAQAQVIDSAIENGRRVAARGGDAVVIIDSLDGVAPNVARRALAAARNIEDGGSLTVIAAAAAPLGGETTVISLDAGLTALRRFPNVDLIASGTLRPELLVGDAGAEKIAQARAEAVASNV